MSSRDWEDWMWHRAHELLEKAQRIQDGFFEATAHGRGLLGAAQPAPSLPVNLIETGDALLIMAAVPGVPAQDVEVRAEDGTVVIACKRNLGHAGRGALRLLEIPYGSFERRVRLPPGRTFALGEV